MAAGDITKELRDRIRTLLGKTAVQGLSDADIYLHLNRAAWDLGWRLADAAMPETFKHVTGSMSASAIALPADFWRERTLYIGTGLVAARWWPLSRLDQLEDSTAKIPSETEPYAYLWPATEGGSAQINVLVGDPASTLTYSFYYQRRPPAMSASVDPVFNTVTCDALVQFAVARFRAGNKDYPEAARVRKQYRQMVAVTNSRFAPGRHHEGVPG
mgnify:CR=1 FL=1